MKRCPVCNEKIQQGLRCNCCGFELSQDYELYQTLGPIDPRALPVDTLRKRLEEERIRQVAERTAVQMGVKAPITEFRTVCSDKNSKEQSRKSKSESIRHVQAGGSFYMGSTNGKRIEWKVLAVEDGKALLLSKEILDQKRYNEKQKGVTWETCTLRKWLNREFINDVFSDEERGRIVAARVTADRNPEYRTSPGRDTTDKVFLLSIADANRYFASDAERTAVDFEGECCWWWLRSPGYNSNNAAFVIRYGSVNDYGFSVSLEYGVRPALWINLEV